MKNKYIAVLIGSLLASTGALGQEPSTVKPQYQIGGPRASQEGPRGISLADGVSFFPLARLGLGRDDNLFLSPNNKTSSELVQLEAAGLLEARQRYGVLSLGANLKAANYNDSSADNYRDYLIRAAGDFQFSTRSGLRLGAQYERGHDPRGSTDRGIADRPDVYRDNGVDALFAFGGNDARGRLELAASSNNKRYRNNRATTASADRDTDRLRGTFFARVMPKTSVLLEVQKADFDYVQSGSTLSSTEDRYYAGLAWEATAATTGMVKFGRQKKDFNSSGRSDFSGSSWDIGVEWKPLSYSKVDFFSSKSFSESSGVGDFILSKRVGALWTHDWNSRVSTAASYSFSKDDFIGAGASRKDETDTLGVKVTYKLGRVVELGADFTRTDRDSNQSAFLYKRNQIMFTVGARL
jgi:polysaccharide biosynthesis protein VpsM